MQSTELSVTRGNGEKEEETVMSINDCVSCLTFLSIPPAHTQTGGGLGWRLKWIEETEGKVVEGEKD